VSAILWKLHDAFWAEAGATGVNGPDIDKDVILGELFPHIVMLDKLEDMSVGETLDYAVNLVHEQSIVEYLSHH
jgi:hypothetical protein